MGVMADKDYAQMIDILAPIALEFVTVTPQSPRAMQAGELAELIKSRGIPARSIHGVEEIALLLEEGTPTVAFGSLLYRGADG